MLDDDVKLLAAIMAGSEVSYQYPGTHKIMHNYEWLKEQGIPELPAAIMAGSVMAFEYSTKKVLESYNALRKTGIPELPAATIAGSRVAYEYPGTTRIIENYHRLEKKLSE